MNTPDRSTVPSKVGSLPVGHSVHNAPPLPQPTSCSTLFSDVEFDADEAAEMATVTFTFQEFLEACFDYQPSMRRGKAVHEVLKMMREDLFDYVSDTMLDPLTDDSRITACLDYLEGEWDK